MKNPTFFLTFTAALIAAVGVFGVGMPGRDLEAHTTNLFVTPSTQLVGGTVTLFVTFLDDEGHDPTLTLSSGVWASVSPSGCISGVGTSVATIDDEACDFDTTTALFGGTMTTTCVEPGTVTISSSLHDGTGPSSVSFSCDTVVKSEIRRAVLHAELPGSGAGGKATLVPVGDTFVVTVDARKLEPLTSYNIRLSDFDGCTFSSGSGTSDINGNLVLTVSFPASSFLTICGDQPAEVSVARNIPFFEVVLKGALGK